MRIALLSATVAAIFLGGCGGIEFADEQINRSLPDDFKNRNIYPETDIFKYKLDSLVGRILICAPDQVSERVFDCDLKLMRITTAGTAPETTTPEQQVWSSKIDQRAATQGSYLAFAANFSAEQAAEILITDSALVFIEDGDVPITELRDYVQDNTKPPNARRFWIQGALLATIIQRDLVKIDANAEGVVGNTTGLKGSVYNKREQDSVDYRISLLLTDIDRDLDVEKMGQGLLMTRELSNQGLLIRTIIGLENLPFTGTQ